MQFKWFSDYILQGPSFFQIQNINFLKICKIIKYVFHIHIMLRIKDNKQQTVCRLHKTQS